MYNKLKKIIELAPYIFQIIYFNFYYLPFKQAIKLPIILYKPKFVKLKGKISIKSNDISPGMIRLGFYDVSLYPNLGIVWENHGGEVTFMGRCTIGNASAISIGKSGNIIFGNNFSATAALKIASYHQIIFGNNVLVGWDNTFIDTDFHQIQTLNGKHKKSFGQILIGNNNWFGTGCLILKNTSTKDDIIVSGRSILNKKYETQTCSVLGGSPAKLLSEGVYRNPNNDIVSYIE